MPTLLSFEIHTDCAPAELEQRLRGHVRRRPSTTEIRLPREQHFSVARPWIGEIGNGRFDILRQSLNPSSGESRVNGTVSAIGSGSTLRAAVQTSWGIVLLLVVVALVALTMFAPELINAPSADRFLASLFSLCVSVLIGPLILWMETGRVESELRAMVSAESAAPASQTP